MGFIKTGDCELLSIIKTQDGKDIRLIMCKKCGKLHKEDEPCPEEEVGNERIGKDK